MNLLSPDSSNAKLAKNAEFSDIKTYILYLVPSNISGLVDPVTGNAVNLCPGASAGCRKACLFTSGRGQMSSVYEGRLRKTKLFVEQRAEFLRQLNTELAKLNSSAKKTGTRVAVRLNGTSDIAWESLINMESYDSIQFYDYTKLPGRLNKLPKNYHLTLSRSEINDAVVKRAALQGHNVAVVFADTLPENYLGRPVIDGTQHDLRFLDPKGVIVGLTAKGKAKQDDSGFVVAA